MATGKGNGPQRGPSARRGARAGSTPGGDAPRRGHGRELLGLALIVLALFLFVAGLSYQHPQLADAQLAAGGTGNWGGIVGHALAGYFLCQFGLPSFLFFGFVLYWGLLVLLGRPPRAPGFRAFGAVALMLVLAIVLSGPEAGGQSARTPFGLGGSIGALIGPKLHTSFGGAGSVLLLLLTGVIAFFVATDWSLREFSEDLRGTWARAFDAGSERGGRRPGLGTRGVQLLRRLPGGAARLGQGCGQGLASFFRRDGASPLPALADGDAQELDVPRRRAGGSAPRIERPERAAPGANDAPVPPASSSEGTGDDVEVPMPAAEPEATDETATDEAQEARRSHTRRLPMGRRARSPRIHRETAKPRKRIPQPPLPGAGEYSYPPLDLLDPPSFDDSVASEESLRRRATAIERRLASHKVEARVVSISAGPAVTVFELEVGEGQRIASITRYSPDLAAALEALSVRVVAPIPGKHTVGIEVPNDKRSFVRLRELIEAGDWSRRAIPLCLGRDVSGKVMVEDLARMPHLLIAGATGSGKSVCINSILLSIMMLKSPAEVRLILIDPKMVELQNYSTIPHLMCPVVTNMKKAPTVLAWAVETMEKRYALLSAVGVRKLQDYNDLGEEKLRAKLGLRYDPEETPPQLANIVVVIDEFADLMTVAAAEVEVSIQRLAQKSRAVGIHVILATQRPSRDVITGLIKANLPTRIAFQVSNRIDSRVILDANGADQLLGHGDLLYIPPGTNRLVRAQGTFVSDDEIHGVVEYLEQKVGRQVFEQELMQTPTGSQRSARERDELFDKAVRIVLEEQRGSATLLQRKLSVGYTRASRLIELMEEEGVVGLHKGSKSREVMLTLEDWEAMWGPPPPERAQGELFAEENVFARAIASDADLDRDGDETAPWEEDEEFAEDELEEDELAEDELAEDELEEEDDAEAESEEYEDEEAEDIESDVDEDDEETDEDAESEDDGEEYDEDEEYEEEEYDEDGDDGEEYEDEEYEDEDYEEEEDGDAEEPRR